MLTRTVTFVGLLAALVGGGVVLDSRSANPLLWPAAMQAMAQAPSETPATGQPIIPGDNSQPDAVKPAEPQAADPKPMDTKPGETPAPVTTAPSAEPSAPVAETPPPLPPQKPAITESKTDKPVPTAKALFSAEKLPSLGKAMAIGYYPRGCLQGGVALPVNGPTWQVMRLSRNRNWGHPSLVRFLEKFAPAAAKATGWKGILIGDMAQPRGGPLPSDHMSHTTGLDVDIWFMPMPGHTLPPEEREKTAAINLVADDWKNVNPKTWTPQHMAFIKTAAEQPGVERVLVNAAIKKEMCKVASKEPWLSKVRPWYAHHDHIHVRLECPADSPSCRKQPPVPEADGCGKDLDYWFSDKVLHPKPRPPGAKPPRPVTMADMPPACQGVLDAPARPQSN